MANRDATAEYMANYRNENRDALDAHRRADRAENRDKWIARERATYQRCAEKKRAYQAEYRKRKPEVIVAQNALRRARQADALGTLTAAEWGAIKARQRGCCFDCGKKEKLTVGHLVPISKGGSHLAINVRGQCKDCNCRQYVSIHPAAEPSLFDKVA
jgi:5-methylcytosine-specific restriction endonuclease McrA